MTFHHSNAFDADLIGSIDDISEDLDNRCKEVAEKTKDASGQTPEKPALKRRVAQLSKDFIARTFVVQAAA